MANPHGSHAGRGLSDGADAVMTQHVIVRDGSVWRCDRCRREICAFGEPMPRLEADCAPRRWGDGVA